MTWSREAFWALAGEEVRAAFAARAGRRSYARGEALMHANEVPAEVVLLRAGRVKVSATSPAGRQVLLAFRGPDELVGELAAVDRRPRSAAVHALEPVEASALAHDAFRALLAEYPQASLALMQDLSARLRDADAKRLQLAAYTAIGRVAFALLELVDTFGEPGVAVTEVTLPLSQEELAGWIGASLESVGRALQTMRGVGWIETRRRSIRVLDPRGLEGALG
jgi:CRP-like cAMP-binding protein